MAKRGKVKLKERQASPEQRPLRMRAYKTFMLVVCEDTKTEPTYFERFKRHIPPNTLFLRAVGTGRDPLGVVTKAVEECRLFEEEYYKPFDCVWAVFDIDDAHEHPTKQTRFENACVMAQQHGIRLAYSNEVFELWLLLHLGDVVPEQGLPRSEIYARLEKHVRQHPAYSEYVYNHYRVDPDFLDIIEELGDEQQAVSRARMLLSHHAASPILDANPSTRVHELVVQLREWITYYAWRP